MYLQMHLLKLSFEDMYFAAIIKKNPLNSDAASCAGFEQEN